jgi:hypothetical protein
MLERKRLLHHTGVSGAVKKKNVVGGSIWEIWAGFSDIRRRAGGAADITLLATNFNQEASNGDVSAADPAPAPLKAPSGQKKPRAEARGSWRLAWEFTSPKRSLPPPPGQ